MSPRRRTLALVGIWMSLSLIFSMLLGVAEAATSKTHKVSIQFSSSADLRYWHPYDESRQYTNKKVTASGGVLHMPLEAGNAYGTVIARGPGGWLIANDAQTVDVTFRARLVKAPEWGGAIFSWPTKQPGKEYKLDGKEYEQVRGEYNWPEWHPEIDKGHPHFYTHATGSRCVDLVKRVVSCPPHLGAPDTGRVDSVKLSEWRTYRMVINGAGTNFYVKGQPVKGAKETKFLPWGPRRVLTVQFGPRPPKGVTKVSAGEWQFDYINATWTTK